jgi:ribokinase
MIKEGILVVGSTNMDMVVLTEKFPKPGETLLGKKFQTFPGGKGANQAVGVAKLGKKTFFITKMGDDDFRKKLTDNLSENGVGIDDILIDKAESTGIALITVDGSGENEIIVIAGSNMKLEPEDINSKKDIFGKAEILLLQLEIPLESIIAAVALANENNIKIILNPAPARELPDELLSKIDFITPNETELETLTGVKISDDSTIILGAKKLIDKGVKNVIVTLGDKGAYLINHEQNEFFPAKKVKATDTTAAGDAFNAGFAYALSEKYQLGEAIKFANVTAAIAVTRMGAQASMPNKSEVLSLL